MSRYLPNSEEQAKEYAPRYRWLYIWISFSIIVMISRLWYLQIMQGDVLRQFSEKNIIKRTRIPSPRGVIFDRNGEVLVRNSPNFVATISPQYALKLEETAKAISPILGIPAERIIRKVKRSKRVNGPFFATKLKDNLTREEVFRLKFIQYDHPGLEISEAIKRSYPLKENGAQLFGYVGEISKKQLPVYNRKYKKKFQLYQGDLIGKRGLEEILDLKLRGQNGISYSEVDARGRSAEKYDQLLGFIPRNKPSQPGYNIELTIDKDIQEAAFEAFNKTDRIGSLVAMKTNGEIVAWLNSPSYDPNEFSKRISVELWKKLLNDPFKPLRNKVIQDHTSPGSTFKAIVALAALEEGVINENTTHFCPGFLKFGRRRYHCHAKHGHGKVNVFQALERSCNIFFYKLGMALGIDRMAKYAAALGIGQKTGILLNGEQSGLMPTTDWKLKSKGEEWQLGENLSNAIGQGFVLTTPLQMAQAYAAIALKGPMYKPFLVKRVLDDRHRVLEENNPVLIRDLSEKSKNDSVLTISKGTFKKVREGLRRVSNGDRGTARWWKIPGVPMAGKTAEVKTSRKTSKISVFIKPKRTPWIEYLTMLSPLHQLN